MGKGEEGGEKFDEKGEKLGLNKKLAVDEILYE